MNLIPNFVINYGILPDYLFLSLRKGRTLKVVKLVKLNGGGIILGSIHSYIATNKDIVRVRGILWYRILWSVPLPSSHLSVVC